jgi:hypothetical protein
MPINKVTRVCFVISVTLSVLALVQVLRNGIDDFLVVYTPTIFPTPFYQQFLELLFH